MKEYKVKEVWGIYKAEDIMNEMAQKGWEVKSTCYYCTDCIVITFEREVE